MQAEVSVRYPWKLIASPATKHVRRNHPRCRGTPRDTPIREGRGPECDTVKSGALDIVRYQQVPPPETATLISSFRYCPTVGYDRRVFADALDTERREGKQENNFATSEW